MMNDYISAQEAADLLNVSVPWFITDVAPEITEKIYTYGKTTYGRSSVLAWKVKRDERRSLTLDELTALGEEMGW